MRTIAIPFSRKLASPALVGCLAAAGLALTAGAPAAPAAWERCTVEAGTPIRIGNTVSAFARVSRSCGGPVTMTLKRGAWYRDVASRSVQASGAWTVLNYNCSGTGTHSYRSWVGGRDRGGTNNSAVSYPLRRVTC